MLASLKKIIKFADLTASNYQSFLSLFDSDKLNLCLFEPVGYITGYNLT
jgi:hypothetical protein